jgi:endonuclease G
VKAEDLDNKEVIEAAVRQVAEEYLRDDNINSVGVGYKQTDGERTGKLVLQFTVGTKLAPEALPIADTRPIPKTITANGIEFETDVIERSFTPQPIPLVEATKPDRKKRQDPIAPGISIGHPDVTAGTLGCVVADAESGETLILSNWHVLHGGTASLGDSIVQPGTADDDRVSQNTIGVLVRSFLGLAGDCAVARPTSRRLVPEIVDLGVSVRRLGDPQLDDRVVKSGRTTDVTFGIVTRVHTVTKLGYAVGERQIGGFEIGPDPERPPANQEISMGGDSGSAWMAVGPDGAPTDMMLGLHFAGESGLSPEVAIACYASSVFKKLELVPLEAATAPGGPVVRRAAAAARRGFDEEFLAEPVRLPTADADGVEDDYAPTRSDGNVRHYTHFSLAMSSSRRFARWVAWNVDGGAIKRLPRKDIDFVTDPEYDLAHQVDDTLYSDNPLDRGHIARRADLLWGSLEEATRANVDSFFFTNITPQLDDFNQSARQGMWGLLENAIFDDVDVDDLKVSVLGGPIFADDDFRFRGILVPRSYWKVVCYVEGGALRVKAFVLTQDDLATRLEALPLDDFKVFQLSVEALRRRTGLGFGALAEADTVLVGPEAVGGPGVVRRIRAPSDLV